MQRQIRRRLLTGLLLGIVVASLLVFFGNGRDVVHALGQFDWRLAPLVVALVLANYALRFLKWQYYLSIAGVSALGRRQSLLIYLSGFSMAMTPGKVGELLKAWFIRDRTGTPVTTTIPVVLAERVTDGAALLALAGTGALVFQQSRPVLLLITAGFVAVLVLLRYEPAAQKLIGWAGRVRLLRSRAGSLAHFYASLRVVLRVRAFLWGLIISIISWFGECVAFFFILVGLGLEPTPQLLLAATFVFGASAWLGGASMLPGGLGATEASMAGLLLLTIDQPAMTTAVASTATLLIRFATLWLGAAIGVVALLVVLRWSGSPSLILAEQPALPGDSVRQ
jgi:uncharacterized protein (TIRG00374 family)